MTIYRRLQPDDIAAATRIIGEVVNHKPDVLQDVADHLYRSLGSIGNDVILSCSDEGTPQGLVWIQYGVDQESSELHYLAVAKGLQRQGLGDALFDIAIRCSRIHGAFSMWWRSPTDEAVMAFYEKVGKPYGIQDVTRLGRSDKTVKFTCKVDLVPGQQIAVG
ncbi:MAG: GNAT family N-acetyltransferase [Bdellovibrionales bacterium]